MNRLIFFIKIWIAYVLDLIFGDPQNVVHPVQVIGKIISAGEKVLLRKKYNIYIKPPIILVDIYRAFNKITVINLIVIFLLQKK